MSRVVDLDEFARRRDPVKEPSRRMQLCDAIEATLVEYGIKNLRLVSDLASAAQDVLDPDGSA